MPKKLTVRSIMPLATVFVVVGLLIGMPWFFQRSLIYFPDRGQPRPAAELLPGAREVTLTTSDGLELGAWYLPAAVGCRTTVLVASGNGGNRAYRAGLGRAISELGFGVLLFDYRGYGANPGHPSEDGLARDVRAAHEFLTGAAGVPAGSLVYFGESIGAGVVTELATEHPPAAMLLRSPFTSLADAGRAAYGVPVGWMLRDHYPVRENVARADVPIAVVYGSEDTIVPAQLSRDVAQAARESGNYVIEVEVAEANHNDAALALGPELVGALVDVAGRGGATGCP
ncbi:alpha/beta hydrolase [Arthrobacter sp.]|uniref:alpha/beta hydrolase n=1 Tax=Arthrobacter sp. TaxID=1667 RepID=UPI002811805C|nr:alpha/beta hydrolase [Arthrobacter sp.]